MFGRPVQLLRRRDFHHLAEIEHDDPIAQVFDHVEIVRDEQHREAEALAQVAKQIDDLRLNRDVECGYWLVGNDELRLDRKRAGDADPLPLPAGEFMGKSLRMLGRETDQRQQFRDPFPAGVAAMEAVRGHRFIQRVAHAPARIQARVRILEDDLQATAVGSHGAGGQRREIGALEPHFAGSRLDQLQHRTADRALARARFADEAQHLAFRDLEADVIDGAHRAVAVAEVFFEPANRQHRRAQGRFLVAQRCAQSMPQRMHRERWLGGTSASGGIAAEHWGSASAQRGAKAQPGSGSSGLAT